MLLATSLSGFGGLTGVLVPLWAVLFAVGLALPNAPALALSRHGEAAGTAASLLGAIQFGTGAAVSGRRRRGSTWRSSSCSPPPCSCRPAARCWPAAVASTGGAVAHPLVPAGVPGLLRDEDPRAPDRGVRRGRLATEAPTLLPVLAARERVVEQLLDSMFPALVHRSCSVSNAEGWHAGRAAADLAILDSHRLLSTG